MLLAISMGGGACPGSSHDTAKSLNRLDLCKDLLSKGEDVGAESECKKAIVYNPGNEEAFNELGLVYLWRAARNERLRAIENCQGGSTGQALKDEEDAFMKQADDQFSQSVALASDYGEAWQNRGVVALHFEQWDKAIAYEEKALGHLERLDPNSGEPLAQANLGWAFYKNGQNARAVPELLKAAQRLPDFCLANYRLGQVLYDQKEYQSAEERLGPLLDDPRKCPIQEAFYLGGQISLRTGDREGARARLQTCVEMAPKSCVAKECERALP